RPMNPNWVRSINAQCHAVGIPFFMKQRGDWLPTGQRTGNPALDHSGEWLSRYEFNGSHYRVGKTRAGRSLDGRTWDESPALDAVCSRHGYDHCPACNGGGLALRKDGTIEEASYADSGH